MPRTFQIIDNPECSVGKECSTRIQARGLCTFHYSRWYRGISPIDAPRKMANGLSRRRDCSHSGCLSPRYAVRGSKFCFRHWGQIQRGEKLAELPEIGKRSACPYPNCKDDYSSTLSKSRLCKAHSAQAWRFSLPTEKYLDLIGDGSCQNPGCTQTGNLHIDHDHSCCPRGRFKRGKHSCGSCVRGALCMGCNTSLGMLQENPERIRGLLDYLRM